MTELQTRPKAASSAVSAWLSDRAIPLTAVTAGSGFADLQPLKQVLKDVTVVGLGEATHGTREFFQFKHRMLEFLAVELGFTVFVIEASYAACLRINEFVLYGQHTAEEVLAGQKFWTWDTEEVLAMIKWMREYNLTQPEAKKLHFYGNDVQHTRLAVAQVREYLTRLAPERNELTEAALAAVERLEETRNDPKGDTDPARKAATLANLERVLGHLAMHRLRFIRQSSLAEYEAVVQSVRVMTQFVESYERPFGENDRHARDLYMAENTEYIAKCLAPGAKLVVWAHNAHLKKGEWGGGDWIVHSQGARMAEIFGPAYYAFGFSFSQGAFHSRAMSTGPDGEFNQGTLTEFTVGPAEPGTIDRTLADAHPGSYIIDFRGAPASPDVAAWLATPSRQWFMGSCYSPDQPLEDRTELHAPAVYDGMVFFDRTTHSRPTPTGVR
jgi:erythromycin esterase